MINSFLSAKICENFGFPPTDEQFEAINLMGQFLTSRRGMELLLLRGYAGTGKTTLVGALVKTLASLKQPVVLMAPTGRAAKVFSSYSGCPAYTIHKRIYRQKSITDDSSFSLNVNLSKHTLFIVDEASMIATTASPRRSSAQGACSTTSSSMSTPARAAASCSWATPPSCHP